ncbi:hypothetical protein [Paracoccus sp. JM45]|uniref:hypothetical protein n=1 Tax=Paracoccus sp. JM45 TaxID=2283626 RepID=UPI000E6C7F86|nr:hypothetical protein [Paracoccus sp. JM45]RJE80945.1 hypothetical protein DWB67_04945 [Paracoccus sp. JM45]
MQDNILIGPDAHSRFTLQMLRAHEGQGEILGGKHQVIDGVFMSCDPNSDVSGNFTSDLSNMLNISIRSSKNLLWQALHIELGDLNLGSTAVLGVVVRSQAASSITTRLCVRSGNGEHFVDTFFSKTMVSFAQPSTHLDVLDLASAVDLPKQAKWRELILFFRAGDVDIDLLDLRLFAV